MWSEKSFLIFDLDGTLVDSSAGVVEATNFALESMGDKPREADEISKFIGFPLDVMFPALSKAPVDRLKRAFQERARTCMVPSAKSLPGVDEILAFLSSHGYTLAIATTKFTIHSTGIVRRLGWEKYFTVIASGDDVPNVKPAPDIIHLAVERLGANPEQAVMIGDTVNDIEAAHRAGVQAIGITSPFGSDDLASHSPDLLLESIGELRTIFNR